MQGLCIYTMPSGPNATKGIGTQHLGPERIPANFDALACYRLGRYLSPLLHLVRQTPNTPGPVDQRCTTSGLLHEP